MSLTTCLKKMGKSLHAQDKADIYAAARKHRSDGLSAIEAARKAVADQLAKADARVSAEESAQRESNESGPEAPADAGVSRSEPLTRAEIDADVKRVFGTAKPLTRLINNGTVSLITKAEAAALPKIVAEAKREGVTPESLVAGSKGLHDGKQGYLITDELQPNEVAGVLIHEIGVHHSMERILGAERFDKLQKAMESFRARGDKDVLAAYAAVPKDTPAHHVNHEAIAYLAEHSANHSITQKLVDATKLFLNRLGVPMSWIKAEPAAVRSIARESLLAESRRGNGSVRYNGRDTLYQKVWHGTPHRDIEKTGFSLQKIGTGEGAQAYGWGLYFASLREVADGYRVALTADQNRRQFAVAAAIASSKWFKPGLVVNGKKYYDRMELQGDIDRRDLTSFDMPADVAKVFTEKLAEPSGNLYRVDIPEDSDLMDWDKPLSEQPDKVRDALERNDRRAKDSLYGSGKEYYHGLVGRFAQDAPMNFTQQRAEDEFGAKAASEYLRSIGIPGLRYLDGGSRRKGEGSANYVIWDETLLTPEKAQITPYYSKRADDDDQTQSALDSTESAATGGDVQSIPDKGVMDRLQRDAKALADLLEGQPFGTKAGGLGRIEPAVVSKVFAVLQDPQILRAVVRTIPVDVMDLLARKKLTAEDALRNKAVLENMLSGNAGSDVTLPINEAAALVRRVATAAAERAGLTGGSLETDGAGDANASNSVLGAHASNDPTKSAAFSRWFGDSKVVDADGKPLVVYHGTGKSFDAFNSKGRHGRARLHFFSDDPAVASEYAGSTQYGTPNVIPVYLSIQRPYQFDAGGAQWGGLPLDLFPPELAQHFDERNILRGRTGDTPLIGFTDVIRAAEAAGYDGVIAERIIDGGGTYGDKTPSRVAVAFRPEQIKSATGNRGTFDPSDPNIMHSRRTPSDAQKDAAARRAVAVNTLGGPTTGGAIGWNFDAGKWEGTKGTIRRARAALDDKMIAWRDVQDSIADHLGNAVPDAQNVYRLENLMHGRVKEGIDALEEKQVVPLVKAMQEAKITPAMLEEYLYALHAKERNAQIAKINPKMPDGGSGMTNAEAEAILAKPLPNGMKEIAKRAKAIIRQTRKRLLDHGIITQDQFDAMESQYQNYVPLRGKTVGENEFDSGGSGAGRGIDGRPSPVKQAFGRGAGNRAENILGEIIGDAQRSIIAAEKARVGRAVMRIVLANPNPKLWTVEPVLTERKLDSTGEVYDAVVNDWSDPSIIAVRHRGKVYKVQINHAPLAKALNLVGVDQIGAVTRAAGALNRYFSAVLTRYNPAFIPVNAARDALFGLTGLAVEHGEVTAMKAALYYPKAIRAAWREARRLPPKSQADTYAREFSEDGGKTGYVSMPSVEELQRKIGSGRFGGYSPQGIGRAAQAVGDLVGAMNDSVENALRLSAYVTLREQGMAREKAASYAKELTVNFNRKGSEGTKLNSWFLFYNASMQGIKRTGALMKSPKTWGYLGALTAAQIAAVMYAIGQEDDDGTPIWDKVPDHVKQRNLVFTWLDDGGEQKILTIPMPYGLNVFPYFAGRVADGMMHAENRPRDRAMSIAADTVSTAVQSFSPVPLDDGAMGLLPTALRIPLSIQVNRDDFGRQIRKENPFGKFDVPRASIGKPDTLEMFKVMATGLNRIGGGDERTPPPMSAFDVAPEDIEYVLEKLGGGTGKFIIDMATVGQKSTGELPVEARDIPIAKRFFTNVNEPAAQQAMFYERREAIERDADMVRDVYEKDGSEAAIALLRSTPSLSGADFRRYKESDPKKGHRKGGIVVVDGRPQLVVRRPDSVYGRYKAAAEETAEVNESMRNAYADSPMSLRPSGERDKRLKELADKRMAAQRIFNAAWNRDVVGGE